MDKKKINLPELLVPAGDQEKLNVALLYGADAVYLGGTNLNLRAAAKGFSFEALNKAVKKTHLANKKIYFALNLFAMENNISQIKEYLYALNESNIDALIIADPGVFLLAREISPNLEIHISTQANTSNSHSVRFWKQLGASRVNLARELSFKDIREIRQLEPNLELEIFVHGAMCMAISGRCFMSGYLNARPGNLGQCSQPCRFDYKTFEVEEKLRPNKPLFRVEHQSDYTKIFAANDLCLLPYLNWFKKNKIESLKIEGRTKTSSYLAVVVDTYRTALDNLLLDTTQQKSTNKFLSELINVASRPLETGFFLPQRKILGQPQPAKNQIVAKINEQQSDTSWLIEIKNQFHTHLPFEFILPGGKRPIIKTHNYCLETVKGEKITTAHPGTKVYLRCSEESAQNDIFIRQSTICE